MGENMETVEQLKKKLNGAIQTLQLTKDEIAPPKKRNTRGLKRLLAVFEEQIDEIHKLKVKVSRAYIEEERDFEEVREWTKSVEEKLEDFEPVVEELEGKIKELQGQEIMLAKETEAQMEREIRQRHREEEIKHERDMLQLKQEFEKKTVIPGQKPESSMGTNAKLPKLVITKFQGTHIDWQRFWNQFEAEIDRADISQVTKFSYLKELLVQSVRVTIDGLPFSTEGYERAKQILKTKYGKSTEVANAHIQNLIKLATVHGTHPAKMHEFYNKLVTSVQALETLGKLQDVKGYVRLTLDKLPSIRADLVRLDDEWQDWGFTQLVEAVRKWCERNPIAQDINTNERDGRPQQRRDRVFQVRQQDWKSRSCVYCDSLEHKSVDCTKITSVAERKKQLSSKRLCFNCTGSKHRATDCRSKTTCQKCSGKHHTSICDKDTQRLMVAQDKVPVTHPVVIVKVNGVQCRALLDTGAGSTYISAALANELKNVPLRKEVRRIDMMMHSVNQKVDVFSVEISSIDGSFSLDADVCKVDKSVLLTLPNPGYADIIRRYTHMQGVKMNDMDQKSELPVHAILGASEYSRIKTETQPKVGKPGDPVAELTKFGWAIMSPGVEVNSSNALLTRTSAADYEQLCSLDVLGLKDAGTDDQSTVYQEFREQLTRNEDGWYETGLLWKNHHAVLQTNKAGSIARLKNLLPRLQRNPELFERYDGIMQEQLSEGIIEKATGEPQGREFYIPHKPVIRESAESTKVRIVYDASARANDKTLSLNDCLETGPPLQNLIWSILVRNRLKPVVLAGDLKQAFLQIRIREEDRDALRFHWIEDKDPSKVATYRFTRALFGLVQSPFLLGATINEHLNSCKEEFPDSVEEIRRCLYVDDAIMGSNTVQDAKSLKDNAITMFGKAQFTLHKWHSNVPELEQLTSDDENELSYAKVQLGIKSNEAKILGITWDKTEDTLKIPLASSSKVQTKRQVLHTLASTFDPLGIASPWLLNGKLVYRSICDQKIPWDSELPNVLRSQWEKFGKGMPAAIEFPRSLARFQEDIQGIDLHAFGDASAAGTGAVVYAVVNQTSGTTQGIVAAKARLSKKNLTIPRLELVSAHMAANMVHNVKEALDGMPIKNVYGWLDSTVALHWIKGGGSYKQFVANRVQKITEKSYIQWRYVYTSENPADLASRGATAKTLLDSWISGPEWLQTTEKWPADMETHTNKETEAEAKLVKEILGVAVEEDNDIQKLLNKFNFWKTVRITAWISRFIHNCRHGKTSSKSGPLAAEETEKQIQYWIRKAQTSYITTDNFKEDQLRLNLQENDDGLYECRGRIQGIYPVYLPPQALLSEKIVMDAHLRTLHGGVGLTMASVREKFWIPRLRQLAKKIVRRCHGCKRFTAVPLPSPKEGNLPRDRTEGERPFQVVGVDYAGPLQYKRKQNQLGKAYLLLFSCSLTRAVYLDLVPDQTMEQFLICLKRFIARKGRPEKIYSDNGRTFIAGANWLKKVMKDEKLQDFISHQNIQWQFNLSKAPWWGGQFERLIGLFKQAMYRAVGRANLTWKELEEVFLDIETTLNNRPLGYVEDDVQQPLLTPNIMMFGLPNQLLEEDPSGIAESSLRKRARYLQKCKQALWSRWSTEYVKALRERHNLKHKTKDLKITEGDVVLIKSEERNRGKWKIGIVKDLLTGSDGVIRGARLRAGRSFMERPVQHLYPLELQCDIQQRTKDVELNPKAKEFRPVRKAAATAAEITRIIAEEEDDDL